MSSRRCDIAFLGLARDCAATIPNFVAMIEALNAAGLTTLAIVGENGSCDSTRSILSKAAASGHLRLEDTGFMQNTSCRLERMALGRQHLANCLSQSASEADAVCILDLDEPMSSPPTSAMLTRSFGRLRADEEIFAIAATSRPTYYDLLAFDDGRVSFERLHDEIKARELDPFEYYRFFQSIVYPSQEKLTVEHEIRCVSAFNGMCLYKAEDHAQGSYTTGNDFVVCEHVFFNRQIAAKTGRSIVIDPGLTVQMPREHGRRSFLGFWGQRTRKLIKRLRMRSRLEESEAAKRPSLRDPFFREQQP